ncbi:MAG TPA: WhiB family transcriptional regulator [Acidimicrobiales bacterium]|nr:WhiB family transcriptional regulator [Acidimicrobiales bacterium]
MGNAWMARGSCREVDPELFFPTSGRGVNEAKRVCASCEVVTQCLEYALAENIEHGIWGGKSERERRRILRARRVDVRPYRRLSSTV